MTTAQPKTVLITGIAGQTVIARVTIRSILEQIGTAGLLAINLNVQKYSHPPSHLLESAAPAGSQPADELALKCTKKCFG